MRFGYCTGFASNMMGAVNYALLDDIAAAGYDYVEFPLMQLEALSAEEFAALCARVPETGLACDVCCNMFPARVRLTAFENEAVCASCLREAGLAGSALTLPPDCPAELRQLAERLVKGDE